MAIKPDRQRPAITGIRIPFNSQCPGECGGIGQTVADKRNAAECALTNFGIENTQRSVDTQGVGRLGNELQHRPQCPPPAGRHRPCWS